MRLARLGREIQLCQVEFLVDFILQSSLYIHLTS